MDQRENTRWTACLSRAQALTFFKTTLIQTIITKPLITKPLITKPLITKPFVLGERGAFL